MARQMMWRRTVSDAVSWRQDQANNATIYILREFGPTGFLLKEDGETKNFKVNCNYRCFVLMIIIYSKKYKCVTAEKLYNKIRPYLSNL